MPVEPAVDPAKAPDHHQCQQDKIEPDDGVGDEGIESLVGEIVGVVNKGEGGIEGLKSELERNSFLITNLKISLRPFNKSYLKKYDTNFIAVSTFNPIFEVKISSKIFLKVFTIDNEELFES